ncbi:MAG: hypothetical protein EA001_10225 [Oscillatoriales cyanobacterium]|nr:MAG: hypothetical protein EA001_10225 [Oscillatoriales cyanobacterium]
MGSEECMARRSHGRSWQDWQAEGDRPIAYNPYSTVKRSFVTQSLGSKGLKPLVTTIGARKINCFSLHPDYDGGP